MYKFSSTFNSALSLLLAVFRLAIRSDGARRASSRGCSTFAALLTTLGLATFIRVVVAVIAALFAVHEAVELGPEVQVELERVNGVQVVKVVRDVVCLFQLLHDLIIL